MIPLNSYDIRQLSIDDKEQFIKLTADAYFYDSDLQRVLELNYEDCAQLTYSLDYEHVMKTGFNYGAFYGNQLVSTVLSFDYTNPGNPQGYDNNYKLMKLRELRNLLRVGCSTEQFQRGEWIYVRYIQTDPDHRGKKLAKILLEKCYQKWKEHKFKYAHMQANHIASKKLLFSLSEQQYVYSQADKLNNKPFFSELVGIKIECDDDT